ncbi:conserved hypothetical protein [Tenacibaculum maritimum]|uniref:hypothetical protein n=1 Tax=Tenacibaculum maritimum TaxID=107401 RepID=UPI0012E463A7|nr:hypothetical protein [Tenacibaculum maritimum]CAA0230639.1 conserved hypothetical protein [Tenacibaculum maritimum]
MQSNLITHLKKGKGDLIENIKILLYKEDPNIFEIIDFDNNDIYQEPLLFSYFNAKESNKFYLNSILFGYMSLETQQNGVVVLSDENGRIYLPNLGWITTEKVNKTFKLFKDKKNKVKLFYNGSDCEFKLESIEKIKNTNIEYLRYPIPLLKQCYYDVDNNLINVEIEKISKTHVKNVIKALNLIKKFAPTHFNLISLVTKKIVVFNVNTYLRNSFADIKAHGISFSNAYQEEYNEVFFVDDISHQTGHIIFTTLTHQLSNFIKINSETILETLKLGNNTIETRSIEDIFHALYTYYTALICLDACLDEKVFDVKKTHEALGRLYFYIGKCHCDLKLVENADINNTSVSINEIFTKNGLEIYTEIKNKFNSIRKKWIDHLKLFDMSNQPYNFTFSKFIEKNPIYEDEKIN